MFGDYIGLLRAYIFKLKKEEIHKRLHERFEKMPHLALEPTVLVLKKRTYVLSRSQRVRDKVPIPKLYNQLHGALKCIKNDPVYRLLMDCMLQQDQDSISIICAQCSELMDTETNPYVVSALERVHCKLHMWLAE